MRALLEEIEQHFTVEPDFCERSGEVFYLVSKQQENPFCEVVITIWIAENEEEVFLQIDDYYSPVCSARIEDFRIRLESIEQLNAVFLLLAARSISKEDMPETQKFESYLDLEKEGFSFMPEVCEDEPWNYENTGTSPAMFFTDLRK